MFATHLKLCCSASTMNTEKKILLHCYDLFDCSFIVAGATNDCLMVLGTVKKKKLNAGR